MSAVGDLGGSDFRPAKVRTEAVGLLAAGLAHDLNNMLGGIVATAELLQLRGAMGGEDARDLSAIIDQAGRASGLIRQILAFSRQDILLPVTAPLDGLLDRFAPMLEALLGKQAGFEREKGAPVSVRIDPTALERAVVNLLLNARAAVGPGGRIRLSTARLAPGQRPEAGRGFMPAQPYGALSVEDDGPGVDPRHAARIFEPYFSTRPDGQGLGLSTAFGLVKQSGGFLLHDRSALGGARFTLYLPEAAETPLREERPAAAPVPVILLAEDDLMLRMSVARGLERHGYRVRQAGDGEAALKRLEGERPSLLLSDIRLPGMDGVALARAARAAHPDLPVLLVSGFADEAARAALPGLGIAFFAKPFTLKSLGERVRELI
ncbi:response regulator [Sandaracinobacter sp. RS1-74]|uniref:response regulator n=1 Tax=Sandaracinobacteroides sayramensis TaxID=2913411 RepID=UPI001EDC74D6|nr:response regulator [Sandaracinobacteroides sayramensis]MCG2842473.1 response regulator [Sandaracinobacteroides sayramensis]